MTTSESLHALRRANPRAQEGFHESVEAAAHAVRAQLTADTPAALPRGRRVPSRRILGFSAATVLAAAAAAVAFLTVASPGGGPGVEDAAAAVRTAAAVTAGAAERSGTAAVRMRRDGDAWAAATIRWNGDDVSIARDGRPGKPGHPLLVVGGVLYGFEEGFGWVAFGDPANIDPDSGTTPAEVLAAVREDVGGATLRRILEGMTGLTAREPGDGTTVYSGRVASRLVATEAGEKDGESLRVLPFGYVANGEASDPSAQLNVAVTVGENDVVREIDVAWGVWTYTVTYSGLGATAAPKAPENARPLSKLRNVQRSG
jgi:hypothetical protein